MIVSLTRATCGVLVADWFNIDEELHIAFAGTQLLLPSSILPLRAGVAEDSSRAHMHGEPPASLLSVPSLDRAETLAHLRHAAHVLDTSGYCPIRAVDCIPWSEHGHTSPAPLLVNVWRSIVHASGDPRFWSDELCNSNGMRAQCDVLTHGDETWRSPILHLVTFLTPVVNAVCSFSRAEHGCSAAPWEVDAVKLVRTCGSTPPAEAQRWHLDSCHKFPVLGIVFHGQGATQFARGPYADIASGMDPARVQAIRHATTRLTLRSHVAHT